MPAPGNASAATHRKPLIACEMCAAVFHREPLDRGEAACCTRCGTILWRHTSLPASAWLALTLAALLVFAIANVYPIASLSVQGMTQRASLPDALAVTWQQGQYSVAVMCGLGAFALPLLQILLLIWVLTPLAQARAAPGFAMAVRLLGLLRPWSMVPVFLLGVLVAVVKLAGMAAIAPGAGLAGFAVLTVLLTMLAKLSPHALWRMAEQVRAVPLHIPRARPASLLTGCHVCGQVQALPAAAGHEAKHHCRRCDAVLHYRKPDHRSRTWALLVAATLLYVPANIWPIMEVSSITGSSAHTILGGTLQLWAMGSWDLAVIVFVASVMVPMTKLLALAALLITESRGNPGNLRQRTRLYQAVEFIGQWSMLDVFVVILLAALAHFQGLMEIHTGAAAAAFGLVVVFTMMAAHSFDPRRSWDLAGAEADRDPVADHPAPTQQRTAAAIVNPPKTSHDKE